VWRDLFFPSPLGPHLKNITDTQAGSFLGKLKRSGKTKLLPLRF